MWTMQFKPVFFQGSTIYMFLSPITAACFNILHPKILPRDTLKRIIGGL